MTWLSFSLFECFNPSLSCFTFQIKKKMEVKKSRTNTQYPQSSFFSKFAPNKKNLALHACSQQHIHCSLTLVSYQMLWKRSRSQLQSKEKLNCGKNWHKKKKKKKLDPGIKLCLKKKNLIFFAPPETRFLKWAHARRSKLL